MLSRLPAVTYVALFFMPKHQLTNSSGTHLSEAKFRAYEEILKDFVSCYPETYRCKPTLSVSTTVVRIREAANSVLTQDDRDEHYATSLDVGLLRDLWPLVQVSGFRDEVMIGTKQGLQTSRQAKFEVSRETLPLHVVNNPSYTDLLSLYNLLLSGSLVGPISITGVVPSDFVCPPGVVMEIQPDKTWLML